MRKAADKPTTTPKRGDTDSDWSGMTLAWQLLDTTWRVALPIIILTIGGIKLDKHFHSNPLYTLIGLFVSLALATFLVYKQIKAAYPDFFKKDDK